MLKKIYFVLDRIRLIGIVISLGWLVVLCFTQVILRYFTPADLRPFKWGDEILRLTVIWTSFLAASLGVREGAHLILEFFINKLLNPKALAVLKKIILVLAIASMCLLIYHGALQAYANRGSYLLNIRFPVSFFDAAIPVGCFYILIEFLLILIFGKHPFIRSSENSGDPSTGSV